MFQHGSLRLFSVRGVPIRAHWTLLLILPYLALVLSVQFRSVASLAGVEDAHLLLPPLIWGAVLALGLFASITLHELAHTIAAIRFGGREASANDAIERAAEAGVAFVIVVDPGAEPPDNLVGLVAAEDIARMVTLQTLARRPPGATTSRPAPLAS